LADLEDDIDFSQLFQSIKAESEQQLKEKALRNKRINNNLLSVKIDE